MKQHIPEEIIEDVRRRADIIDVVSDAVHLKKSGKNYKGLCPFHQEKTPSFTASPDKQIYHCFGCGAGGNVFKFLMETEDLSFIEAVKKLANRYQVPLPESALRSSGVPSERETLFHLNTLATEYFAQHLTHPQSGRQARQYLQSRGFDDAVITAYQLGWAPDEWRGLLTHFEKKTKCTPQQLEKYGLIIRNQEKNVVYDRFRGRLIFPIRDTHGQVIGFGGRVLGDGEPKYLNSSETAAYKKGNHLFGLNLARTAIRQHDRVLIVEGYFDQIRAWQAGMQNTVATCGTALTPQQASLLKQYTQNVVLVFDADNAGLAAAARGFEVLKEQGLNVFMVALPEGEDPDSLIQKQGAGALRARVEQAAPYIHFVVQRTLQESPPRTPQDKLELINRLLPLLTKVSNAVERSEYVRYIAETVGVEDRALLDELRKALAENKPRLSPPVREKPATHSPEWYLVHILLADADAAVEIRRQIEPEAFQRPECQKTARFLYALIDAGQPLEVHRLLDHVEDADVKSVLTRVCLAPMDFDNLKRALNDCILEIRKRSIQEQINDLRRQRNAAEQAGETGRSRELHDRVRKMQFSLIPD
ncbi:DNA primase [Nitrospina watsonii]|uniref:DNA primase n=1 Tax=Nitrospina watsonii TaxID=1323948 RepID=A0ABM9HC47_9BACT|nr:DNA primase [Nitrospina watsonii]CAI2717662.1 DNA primase [Nitrospina watsonii]